MSLNAQLTARAEATKRKITKEKSEIMNASTNALIASGIVGKALKTGDTVSDFTLSNALNKPISLYKITKNKCVVLSFYRGGWCPYCNMELKALQNILPEIRANNAELIAITPELPNQSLTTSDKNELAFEVLSDVDNKVAKDFGLVFKMPENLQALYKNDFNINVSEYNGNQDYELPLAATYIINENGTIIYDFISEHYTERAEPSNVLAALKTYNTISNLNLPQ